jgi:hypothetical protein
MSRLSGNRGGILKVLLIIFGVVLLLCVISGIYVAMHWKGWAADFANVAAQEVIREAGLPENQRDAILSEVKQFGEDFKAGRVTMEELGRVAKAIADSPVLPVAGVQAAQYKYIEPSDMSPDEKAAGVRSLQRFARGVHERKISKEIVDDVIKPVAEMKPNGRWSIKDNPTRMELDQFIDNAKARADEAMIPNEPFDLDIADELRKAIRG